MKVKYEREKKQILKNEGKREGASMLVLSQNNDFPFFNTGRI